MLTSRQKLLIALGALGVVVLVAAAAAGATFLALKASGGLAPGATGGGGPDAPPQDPRWIFVTQSQLPPEDSPRAGGIVAVGLTRTEGDLNETAPAAAPVEIIAVPWDAREVRPTGDQTLTEAFNARFEDAPITAQSRARLSRPGDLVDLAVPPGSETATVIVHAPATQVFLLMTWPDGTGYGWDETKKEWSTFRDGVPPILALPPDLDAEADEE